MPVRRASRAFAPAALLLLAAAPAPAQTLPVAFTNDNDVALFPLTVGADGLNVLTTGYAAGGFDPVLSLFDAGGALVEVSDDYQPGLPESVLLLPALAPGAYTLALTQFDNFAAGPDLAAGFLYDGAGNEAFTSQFAAPGGPAGPFLNAFGEQRTNLQTIAFVPEPGVTAFAAASLALCGGLLLRRRK